MTAHDERDQLPLADYDHITVGDLPARINGLSAEGIQALLEYEREHANRLPVVNVLERRADALAGGAEPSGAVLDDSPTMSHGTPTNPAQPR